MFFSQHAPSYRFRNVRFPKGQFFAKSVFRIAAASDALCVFAPPFPGNRTAQEGCFSGACKHLAEVAAKCKQIIWQRGNVLKVVVERVAVYPAMIHDILYGDLNDRIFLLAAAKRYRQLQASSGSYRFLLRLFPVVFSCGFFLRTLTVPKTGLPSRSKSSAPPYRK